MGAKIRPKAEKGAEGEPKVAKRSPKRHPKEHAKKMQKRNRFGGGISGKGAGIAECAWPAED